MTKIKTCNCEGCCIPSPCIIWFYWLHCFLTAIKCKINSAKSHFLDTSGTIFSITKKGKYQRTSALRQQTLPGHLEENPSSHKFTYHTHTSAHTHTHMLVYIVFTIYYPVTGRIVHLFERKYGGLNVYKVYYMIWTDCVLQTLSFSKIMDFLAPVLFPPIVYIGLVVARSGTWSAPVKPPTFDQSNLKVYSTV